GGLELRPGLRERMSDRLVLSDGSAEDDALPGVLRGALERSPTDPDRFDRGQYALGVQGVEQVIEATPDPADHIVDGNLQAIDEELVRVHGTTAHLFDLAHGDGRPVEGREEQREPGEGLVGIARRRASQQEDVRGLPRVRVPDLAAVHDEAITPAFGARLD